MNDTTISPPEAAPDDSGGSKVYASIKSLMAGGTSPAVGDEVELTVKGNVESVDGDVVCVTPTEVNGEPAPMAPAAQEAQMSEHDQLMKQAQEEDGYQA